MTADPASTTLRILECSGCSQPVWAEPAGSRITLHCGYCGLDDVRELSSLLAPQDAEQSYRGSRGSRRSRRVDVDLTRPPEGVPKAPTIDALRKLVDAARKRIAEIDADSDERAACEHRVVFCSAALSNQYRTKHDHVRARAVLESALETVSEPVYRAIVLGRLARLAAFEGAPELTERWLAALPPARVAELDTDVRVARAALVRAKGDAKAVLDVLGQEQGFVGASRNVAMALRADAYERLGDLREARRVYRRGSRGNAFAFGAAVNTFELAPRTRKRTMTVGVLALGVIVLAFLSLGLALHGSILAAVGLMVFAIASAIWIKMM